MSFFQFKDFSIRQAYAPLKVSTDAILLGASVTLKRPAQKILDVGTGNGVIALLLASRFDQAQITGIDPDEGAFIDAQYNFVHSKYADRLNAIKRPIHEMPLEPHFDTVVCNPPFFIDDLQAQKIADIQAKHLSPVSYFKMIEELSLRCQNDGQIWLILPHTIAKETQIFLSKLEWFCVKELRFHANPLKLNKRWVLCFQKVKLKCQQTDHFIRDEKGAYHADYRQLAGSFHDREI